MCAGAPPRSPMTGFGTSVLMTRSDLQAHTPDTEEKQAGNMLVLDRYAPIATESRATDGIGLGVEVSTQQPVAITSVDTTAYPSGTILRLEHLASLLLKVRSESLSSMLAVGRQDNILYLVQDRLPATTLDRHLQDRNRLSLTETLAIGRSVLRALNPMHAQGVVHGDVHPRSIHLESTDPISRVLLATLGPPNSLEASAHSFSELARLAVHMSP